MKKFMKNHTYRSHNGFTLVELIVVMAIIAILASLLVANFLGINQRGRDTQRKADLQQIRTALELYRSDAGTYPDDLYATSCPTSSSITGSGGTVYMQKIPCDPKDDSDYLYTPGSSPILTYYVSVCLENSNDQDSNTMDDAGCTSGKRYVLQNP